MFHVSATINTDTHEHDDIPFANDTLDGIWKQIVLDYPTVTSVVLVFCTPDQEQPNA